MIKTNNNSKKRTNEKRNEFQKPVPKDDNIIEVNNITMRFNLAREKTETLKEYFIRTVKKQLFFTEFLALQDVSLQVKRGDAVALIGKNGSGKSTLLKCIAGVMYPTSGMVTVHGSIAPMIELGAGFDFDLTAHENIYLNGAVLGHDRKYMDQHFEEIIEFAELKEFVDVPVKNFSSGMIARLGFSIATAVKADIIICDEVLSVGDAAFQQKCITRMEKMIKEGSTLLFVSHSTDMVKKLCNRAIWLDHGKIVADSEANVICDEYSRHLGFEP